jgi:thioesterase domain-containing protein
VYGLQSPGLIDGKECETIESVAAHHIRSVRGIQPSGPYYLGGFCFGGLVAFEMAQQLRASGERVAFLAILDYQMNWRETCEFCWAPVALAKWVKNFALAVADFLEAREARRDCIQRAVARLQTSCARKLGVKTVSLATDKDDSAVYNYMKTWKISPRFAVRMQIQRQAWLRYQPRVYPGPLTLFRQRRLPVLQPYDETLGWSQVVPEGLKVCLVPGPGFHGYMMTPAGAPGLAKRLECSLASSPRTEMPNSCSFEHSSLIH